MVASCQLRTFDVTIHPFLESPSFFWAGGGGRGLLQIALNRKLFKTL